MAKIHCVLPQVTLHRLAHYTTKCSFEVDTIIT